ncbi:MAG: hypothetical protein ACNFW9_03440 [Candidatus Kerfeldbacteria bacterium]
MNTDVLQPLPDEYKDKTSSEIAVLLFDSSKINNTELANILGIGRTTLWRYRKKKFSKLIMANAIIQALGYIPPNLPQRKMPATTSDDQQLYSGTIVYSYLNGTVTYIKWLEKKSETLCKVKLDKYDREIVIIFPYDITDRVFRESKIILVNEMVGKIKL